MSQKVLQIVTKPELSSNKHLEEKFTAEIFRRVESTSRSVPPQFIFFRPQSRPKEEFDENIAPLLREGQNKQGTIMVSISNNIEKSDSYLNESGFTFELKVKLNLTEGELDISQNEETFVKLTNTLIHSHRFIKLEEGKETKRISGCDINRHYYSPNEVAPVVVPDKRHEESEDIRLHLKDFIQPTALMVLNDVKSEYKNSPLSALEDFDVPCVQKEMRTKQCHAYKLEDLWILDLGSTDNLDLGEAVFDKVSSSRRMVVIIVQQRGSTIDVEKQKMKIKSKSIREGASWHIVVVMGPTDSFNVMAEQERVSRKNKIPIKQIHFVRNYTNAQTDICSNFVHLTVLRDIMDSVIKQPVSKPKWPDFGFRVFLISSAVVVVTAIAYWLTTVR